MHDLERIKPYEAKRALTTLLNKVAYGKKPVILESRGHDLAVLISMEQFRALQAALARMEDEEDWMEAEEALAESKGERIAWEDIKRELSLPDRVPASRGATASQARPRAPGPAKRRHQRARR